MSENSYVTREDLVRRLDLLQKELQAENKRVQTLERNLDTLLRNNAILEGQVYRMRAMLTVALGDKVADAEAMRVEFSEGHDGITVALSRALLNVLQSSSNHRIA